MQSGNAAINVDLRFDRKLATFLSDYQLKERPALVLQAWPIEEDVEVDLGMPAVRVALVQGNADASIGPWDGLQSSVNRLLGTVDGLACRCYDDPPTWASELHTDGHVIAGVWNFEPMAGMEHPFITWQYADFFTDFGRLASNLAAKLDLSAKVWMVGATLTHSDLLHYGSEANRRTNRLRPPLRREVLEFRVRRCQGASGLQRAAALTRKDFRRAYGEPM